MSDFICWRYASACACPYIRCDCVYRHCSDACVCCHHEIAPGTGCQQSHRHHAICIPSEVRPPLHILLLALLRYLQAFGGYLPLEQHLLCTNSLAFQIDFLPLLHKAADLFPCQIDLNPTASCLTSTNSSNIRNLQCLHSSPCTLPPCWSSCTRQRQKTRPNETR